MNISYHVGDDERNVSRNRRIFLKALSVPEEALAIPQQQHTATVCVVNSPGRYDNCDALVTGVPGIFLSVSVADCTPIFLFDRKNNVVGCVHAGWRGTEQRIAENTLRTMVEQFNSNPADILAYIGPSANACCYEVGDDVAGKFDQRFIVRRGTRKYLDIKSANEDQLRTGGIPPSNIEKNTDCTICNPQLYHSYRRDRQRSGRMMGVIGIKQ